MLCVHSSIHNRVNTFIRVNDSEKIESTDCLKILGFTFGREPNAKLHVEKVIERFHSKLWTLRFLKKSGMCKSDLINVYETVIRPSVQYSSVVYNSLIPSYLSERLESVQRRAVRIIHGYDCDIRSVIESSVKFLKQRREEK